MDFPLYSTVTVGHGWEFGNRSMLEVLNENMDAAWVNNNKYKL